LFASLQFKGRIDVDFYRQEMLDIVRQKWPTVQNLYGFECVFNVSARDWFFNMTEKGFASTVIFNPGIKLVYIGGPVRTFKPDSVMPIYVSRNLICLSYNNYTTLYDKSEIAEDKVKSFNSNLLTYFLWLWFGS